jgi:hypothetical protein
MEASFHRFIIATTNMRGNAHFNIETFCLWYLRQRCFLRMKEKQKYVVLVLNCELTHTYIVSQTRPSYFSLYALRLFVAVSFLP